MMTGPSFYTLARRSLTLWVGAMFLFVGSVFLHLGIQNTLQEAQYRQEGVVTQAMVLSKSIQRAKRSENSRTKYFVTYQFRAADGQAREGTDEVSVEEWERIESGSLFPVIYLPDNPESHRQEGKSELEDSLLTLSVGGGLCAFGAGLLAWRLAGIRRELRLRREGMVAEGTVVVVKATNTAINNVRQWRIHYRYRDHLGLTRKGSSDLLAPDEASPWHAGAAGIVRFDRLRPQDSVWVGKA